LDFGLPILDWLSKIQVQIILDCKIKIGLEEKQRLLKYFGRCLSDTNPKSKIQNPKSEYA
jgi:hypothetical protein